MIKTVTSMTLRTIARWLSGRSPHAPFYPCCRYVLYSDITLCIDYETRSGHEPTWTACILFELSLRSFSYVLATVSAFLDVKSLSHVRSNNNTVRSNETDNIKHSECLKSETKDHRAKGGTAYRLLHLNQWQELEKGTGDVTCKCNTLRWVYESYRNRGSMTEILDGRLAEGGDIENWVRSDL